MGEGNYQKLKNIKINDILFSLLLLFIFLPYLRLTGYSGDTQPNFLLI